MQFWYELAHDRLVQPIKESNRDWRRSNQNPLQHRASLWLEAARPDDLLLRGVSLEEAERWSSDHGDQLNYTERRIPGKKPESREGGIRCDGRVGSRQDSATGR